MATARQSIRQFQTVMAEVVSGANSPDAAMFQRLLGPTGADGKWGVHTLAAMNDIQAGFALAASPLPDAALFAAINQYKATSGGLTPLPDLARLLADIAAYKAEKAAQAVPDPANPDPEPTPDMGNGSMALYQEPVKAGWEWWKWALAIAGGTAAVGVAGYLAYRYLYLPSQQQTHAKSYGDPEPDEGPRFGASDFTWGD